MKPIIILITGIAMTGLQLATAGHHPEEYRVSKALSSGKGKSDLNAIYETIAELDHAAKNSKATYKVVLRLNASDYIVQTFVTRVITDPMGREISTYQEPWKFMLIKTAKPQQGKPTMFITTGATRLSDKKFNASEYQIPGCDKIPVRIELTDKEKRKMSKDEFISRLKKGESWHLVRNGKTFSIYGKTIIKEPSIPQICENCNGRGIIISKEGKKNCKVCSGDGTLAKSIIVKW